MQTGGGEVIITGLNVMGERVATLEGVRTCIQGIHSSGNKLTDYQQYISLHSETVRLDSWNKYLIGLRLELCFSVLGQYVFRPL